MPLRRTVGCLAAALLLAGCGLNVASPDLFVLTRTQSGQRLTLLVNDGGTIRCNGSAPRSISDELLIAARTLADDLSKDAKASLRISPPPNSVATYTVKLQQGTISFPDTAAAAHPELAEAEQFALRAAEGPCRGVAGGG